MFCINIYESFDREWLYTTLPLEVFTQRNFVADLIRLKLNFIQKTKNSLLSHPLGDLGITYALHLGPPIAS